MNTAGVQKLSGDLIISFISPAECQLQEQPGERGRRGTTRSQVVLLLNAMLSTHAEAEPASLQEKLPSPKALEEASTWTGYLF